MKFYLIHLLTVCQVLLETLAFSSTKTIYLPPESADELHLGCYEEQKNKSSFYQPGQNGLSLYCCIEACGYEKFPLAAVFNDTNCHCADESVTLLIKNDFCNSSEEGKIFQMYNTSCFMVEHVELYQELIFKQFPSKITPLLSSSTPSVTLSIPSSVTTLNLSDSIQDSEKFTRFSSEITPSPFPSISSVTLSIPSTVTTLNLSDPIQYSETFTRFSSKITPSPFSSISSVTLSIPSSVTTLNVSDSIQDSEKFTRFSSKITPSLFSSVSSVTLSIPSSVTALNLSDTIQYSEKFTRFSSKITPSLFSSISSVMLSIPSSVTTLHLSDPIQYSKKFARFSSKMTPSLFSGISSVTLSIPSSVTKLNLSDPLQYSEKSTRFSSMMTPSLFSSVSSITPSTPLNVTPPDPILYSVDFGDGTANSSLQGGFMFTHRYATTGVFNLTLTASRHNWTIFNLTRMIRVISRLHLTGMECPDAVTPWKLSECTLVGFRGSDVLALVALKGNTSQNITISDVPRITLETEEGRPVTNKTDFNGTLPGTFILPSLEFSAETSLEAWELHAEDPGPIELQVYRADWNTTNCTLTRHPQPPCGDWAPSIGQCGRVCIHVKYCQRPVPISSCAHKTGNYIKVYSIDVNLTVGYNLIVVPEEERFIARAGDVAGFRRNTSGAALQRTTAEQTSGAYYSPVHIASGVDAHLESMLHLNISFRMKLRGSVRVHAKLTVSCFSAVGIYPLLVTFVSAIPMANHTKAIAFQTTIAVQNAITKIMMNDSEYVVVNTTRNMTANVLSGTNVTCEWNTNASLLEQQSRQLAEDNTTEGAFCHLQFHFSHVGYFPVTLRAYNLVSNKIKKLDVFVREIIRGLKVEMCYSSFAFDNALTCYNASVETGTKVRCKCCFNPTEFIVKNIGKRIDHGLTPVGNRSFTLYCYNYVPQLNSVEAVNVIVKVVENPLSIKAPLIVATDTLVNITCQINWPGSSPASFFAKHGLTGKTGTDIVAAPNLTLEVYSVKNTSVRYVVLYKSFRMSKMHTVKCIAKNHPDLNTLHQIKAIHSITGIDVNSSCDSSIEIGTRCRFEAQMSRGDSPKYGWTVAEGDARVYKYSGRTIKHQFRSVGGANITVNIRNDVSLNSKAISFVVYSPSSYASSVGTSQPLTSITPSNAFQSSLVVTPTQSPRFASQISSTSQTSLSRYPFPATTVSASLSIPSLQNVKLHHASSGLVGHAINFSVSNVEMAYLLHFSWNWDDQSSTEEGGTVMTHSFTTPGQYFACVNISSGIDRAVLCGHVTVQHPIKGLQIRNIAVGSEKTLILEFEILQGTNVTYSVDYGDNSAVQEEFLSSLPRVIRVRHQYGEPGTYTLSISAKSMVSPNTFVPSRTLNIMNTPCVVNELRMLAVGENSSDCPEIPQEYEYSIYSSLQINCSGVEEINYEWKVQQLLNDSTNDSVPFHNQPLSSDVLFLPAKSLRGGLYKFTLMVTAMPLGISKAATGFLRVRLAKLLASIDCGSERVMSWDKAIVLNGSASHDPNENDVSKASSSLIFEWFYYPSGNISGFKRPIDNKQPVLILPPESLDFNTTYHFVLSVTEGSRQATAMQTIKVLAGSVPPLCVRCKENCAYKLRTSEELVLTSEGCYDNKTQETKTCKWELHGPRPSSNGISRRSVDSGVINISCSNQFKLDPSDLIPNQTYTIFFNMLNSTFSAQYSLTTDAPPSGGSCSVSPSEGVAIKTQFRISCQGWTDEDSPLWYEYFFKHATYGSMLLFYGWVPFTDDLFLPPGLEKHNFTLELFVKITDVLGSHTVFSLQAKVRSFNSDAGSVSSNLRKIVSGPHSKLEKLLAAREFRQATQLMSTVVTMLNRESIHVTDSLDTENRVEVRSRVIQGLSGVSSSSPHGIRQALGGLLPAISVSKELSPDSMVDGANALTNMAKVLATTFKSVRADNITKNILIGLNFVLDAAIATSSDVKREQGSSEIRDWIDDSNEARNKDHQEKCKRATNKSLEGINYSAQKLLDYQRKGDPPLHVKSGLMKLTVTSQSPSNISAAALDGGMVTFQLPTEVKKNKLDRLDAVNTKVVTMSHSPFVANDVIPVTSPVSTLELLDVSGKEIKIRNLTEPVSIFLSLNESENRNPDNIRGIVRPNDNMTFFKITLEKEFFLYLQIRCSGMMDAGEEMIVMGKKNVTPSNKNFDVLWTIHSCNTTVEKLLSGSYLNTSGEFYLGVKLSDAGNVTNGTERTSKMEFNISVRSVGCYYWNESIRAWTTNGCKVGPSTTLKRIQCQCNHLTWFGSRLFVPPNKLHLDIIAVKIKDPSNYALVLAVFFTTCGLYVIALVWARRQDRKDVQKIGTTVSPSNRPEDTHAYEVIISTGMRRHAGTSANVSMLMTGERGESHAFLLKNSQCMTLARSSVNSFLVKTSETLGELSYIRVWHDNFGGDPSWYVKQISIREISSDRVWHFLCEHWLAVDEGDGLIDRIFPVASDEEMKEFRRMFVTKAYKDLTDSHLWFSVVCRPPQSPFTRVQRVSCCFSLLLCTMMANAMWYEADKGRYTAVKVGTLEFSWEQVSIGICSSLIVFPINLILVQIFRHCSPRPPQKNCRKQREQKSSTATEISMVKFESGQSSIHGHYCPAGVYRKLNIVSPSESIESLSGKQKFNQTSAMRSIHFQPPFVSLGASTMNDSTNDVTSLLLRENVSGKCSPVEAPERSNTMQDKQFSNGRRLPWWFVYVGWALVTITSLSAASVTLLYGIQFGLTKSAQWLLSMFFSVTQDIFVSQPLKVVALAIFFAYIFKKPNIVMFSTSSFHRSDDQWLQEKLEEEHTVVPPAKVPSEDTLRRARDRAAKERAMHVILLDLGTYLVFTLLVLLIAYGFRDQDAFHQNDAVAKVILDQSYIEKPDEFKRRTFSQLSRQRDVWNWTENILLPTLYNLPSYIYTKKAPKFIEGESGLVVGVARFRQHRVKNGSCSVISQVRDMFSRCADNYHTTSEDDQAYTAGWESLINTTELLKQTSSPDPWRYSTSSDLNGYPYSMGIETYSGGGYVIELSHIYYKAVRQMKEAKSRLWLDHYTRSVFAEFTLFNPNSNLFSAATFLMERLPTGGVFPSAEVLSYRLYRYVGDFQLFILACELFFFVFVLYFTYRETKKIYKTRRLYFAEVWNLVDLTVLILCWIAIAYYFICLGLRKWTLNLYHENPTKFISFQYISAWQLMFEGVVGVTVFATCLKFIKLFRFNRRIFLLSCTLRRAGGELLQYSIVFLVAFIAFAQLYHFLFSTDNDSFNTLLGSMQKLLSVLLGKFNINEMMSAHKLLGVMIFLLYMVITNFLLLNILIVIIIDSFNVVKQQNDQMKNDFELLEYIMARFKDAFGIRTLDREAAPLFVSPNNGFTPALTSNSSRKTHVEDLEVFDKMEDALDRLVRYVDTVQGIDNDDDMLCCYISRRIHSAPAIKIETVPVDVQSRRARSCNYNL